MVHNRKTSSEMVGFFYVPQAHLPNENLFGTRITYYKGFALRIAKHYPPADHGDLTEK
jgi:hypothetical protein